MIHRGLSSIAIRVGLAALALAAPIFAQGPEQSRSAQGQHSTSTPDLSGIWAVSRNGAENPGGFWVFTTDPYPMQPWAARDFQYARRGDEVYPGRGRDELNPQVRCIPYSFPLITLAAGRPFEIFHVPGRVMILYERGHNVRQIWLNEEHPPGYPLSFMGHSVGQWEGDTLVVDTTRLRGNNWMDTAGHQLSEEMHIVERIRRVNHDTLVIDYLFDDPKVYTRPFTGQRTFKLHPEYKGLIEDVVCDDPLGKGGQ